MDHASATGDGEPRPPVRPSGYPDPGGPGHDRAGPDRTDLEGCRMLVVGASSGIGRAIALAAGRDGAHVAVAARRKDLVEQVAAEIRGSGGRARAWCCDVTDESQCRRLVAESSESLGGIDAVVYMAGSSPLVRIEEATGAVWHELMATNLVGAALVVAGALEHLRRSARPVVVVTTHSMGRPWPWLGVYGATKAAVAEFARALRSEEPGLRVVCVSVGATATSFADGWDPELAGRALELWIERGMMRYDVMQPEEMAAAILAAVTGRTGPDELLIAAEPQEG